ncbi:hypothetical protein [Wolbachia endosymbiont (group B) of Limnophora tigrina]|uniref:hypothetical protein n=1 Tax=Wolbachia endosymbiont (group B) of Limnophora tigrina TaxID=3139317 RepID=UPI0035B55748
MSHQEGVIPVLDTGIQLLCNLIKNVCFSVRQLPLAHQLSYKQNFWIPVSGHCPLVAQTTTFVQLWSEIKELQN